MRPASAVDLRSDTVTLPTPDMRRVMAQAKVGDDVYDEDPTVIELEHLAAGLAGKQAGLFVPSGSMANLIAQMVHADRGSEVVLGEASHAVLYEVGAGAAIAGVQYSVIPGDGRFTAEQARERIKQPTFHTPGTSLLWIENTHNMGGGTIFPTAEIKAIAAVAREAGLPLHMDGARVFNAVVASGETLREVARDVDSLSFCLSKGLGAPVGSVLVGTREFRTRAHRFRKMLGGGMRQVGILAAAGIYALEHHVERLAEDHRRARRLAETLAEWPGVSVDVSAVETNIVMVDLHEANATDLARLCAERGVLFHALTPGACAWSPTSMWTTPTSTGRWR
ncbi:MAG: low-specificity L-threonine aldolase [Acidobacteriota bacterium]|nr:low-specificity L-threonine aldolase [Acidobacteriota bacterium]